MKLYIDLLNQYRHPTIKNTTKA